MARPVCFVGRADLLRVCAKEAIEKIDRLCGGGVRRAFSTEDIFREDHFQTKLFGTGKGGLWDSMMQQRMNIYHRRNISQIYSMQNFLTGGR